MAEEKIKGKKIEGQRREKGKKKRGAKKGEKGKGGRKKGRKKRRLGPLGLSDVSALRASEMYWLYWSLES